MHKPIAGRNAFALLVPFRDNQSGIQVFRVVPKAVDTLVRHGIFLFKDHLSAHFVQLAFCIIIPGVSESQHAGRRHRNGTSVGNYIAENNFRRSAAGIERKLGCAIHRTFEFYPVAADSRVFEKIHRPRHLHVTAIVLQRLIVCHTVCQMEIIGVALVEPRTVALDTETLCMHDVVLAQCGIVVVRMFAVRIDRGVCRKYGTGVIRHVFGERQVCSGVHQISRPGKRAFEPNVVHCGRMRPAAQLHRRQDRDFCDRRVIADDRAAEKNKLSAAADLEFRPRAKHDPGKFNISDIVRCRRAGSKNKRIAVFRQRSVLPVRRDTPIAVDRPDPSAGFCAGGTRHETENQRNKNISHAIILSFAPTPVKYSNLEVLRWRIQFLWYKKTMEEVNAIVAGAGIWGCTVARRLAEAGRKVLVLENGTGSFL